MMPNELIFLVFCTSVVFLLLFGQDVNRLTKRIYCRFGKHDFTKRERLKSVNSYKCNRCNATKPHPHLKIIDGGKKVFENKYRW